MEYLWYQQGDIANYALNLDLVARTIFTLFPVKLTLGITCKGVAFPLLFSLLDKCGNSNWEERKDIMEGSSDFLGMTASTALWPTASSSARSGLAGLTTTGFDTISVSGRTFGLSSPPQERELEHGGSSIPLKSGRRISTTSPFCIKGSMFISPEVESRTLKGYPNFRSWSVSTDLKME